MATLNIKDPEVHRLAHELASKRHTTATGAVRSALREALAREQSRAESARRVGLAERLMEIGQRSAAMREPFLSDDELYDERGLPR